MAYSVNTTPLLQEYEYDSSNDEEIPQEVIIKDTKPIFKASEPRDNYYCAYLIFYLLGIVTLLPWNFFITADDYWMYKFRNVDTHNSSFGGTQKRTPLQAAFTSYISICSSVPCLVFLVLNTLISQRISLNIRMIGSLVVMLIFFVLTLVLVSIDTDKWQHGFFIITLITVVLLNVCSAILGGSVFGVMAKFGPTYITATIGGQALGGIFAALCEIASLSIGASSTHSANVYFSIGVITIVMSILCYIILCKSTFFRHFVYGKQLMTINENSEEINEFVEFSSILKKIWAHGASIFFCFLFTLTVCPGVTVLIESEGKGHGNKWNDVFFVPTINYLLFSVGDYFGRLIAGKILKPKSGLVLLILSISRFVFIPLLMLCNAQPRYYNAVVFDKDYQYILILFLCALSNGYLANITVICAPRIVDHHEREMASTMMTVFMGIGLALGSTISLFMVKFL